MIHTISRPPTDTFSYKLFRELLDTLTCQYDAYYLWSNPPDQLVKFFNNTDFGQQPNVIIGIKDLLDLWTDYNYWQDHAHAGTRLIDQTASRYPNTNFVILTSVENLHLEQIQSPNVQIVPWGGDCVNQHAEYQTLKPVFDKDFSEPRHVISLNRNLRDHRIVYISYLLGENLESTFDLSCLGIYQINPQREPQNFLDRIFWEFDNDSDEHDRIRDSVMQGYEKFFNNRNLIVDDYEIYAGGNNDNILNFNQCLRFRYRTSFLEIITESSFSSPGYMLTEKTMHGFYACNFPILLSGQGAVGHLRDIGFDMFDDIIDHSYDLISNPIDRIVQAVDQNRDLLTDAQQVKKLWVDNQERFHKNIHVANHITDYYTHRAKKLWSAVQWK